MKMWMPKQCRNPAYKMSYQPLNRELAVVLNAIITIQPSKHTDVICDASLKTELIPTPNETQIDTQQAFQ